MGNQQNVWFPLGVRGLTNEGPRAHLVADGSGQFHDFRVPF